VKARRLLWVLALILGLFASYASANPYPLCQEVCTPDSPCSTRCSVWYDEAIYQNVTCSYFGVCAFPAASTTVARSHAGSCTIANLVNPLSREDSTAQAMPDASTTK
jgi:hypothetical protein